MFLAVAEVVRPCHGAANQQRSLVLGAVVKPQGLHLARLEPEGTRQFRHCAVRLQGILQREEERTRQRPAREVRHLDGQPRRVAPSQEARQGGFHHQLLLHHECGVYPPMAHSGIVCQCCEIPSRHAFGQGELQCHLALLVGAQGREEERRFLKMCAQSAAARFPLGGLFHIFYRHLRQYVVGSGIFHFGGRCSQGHSPRLAEIHRFHPRLLEYPEVRGEETVVEERGIPFRESRCGNRRIFHRETAAHFLLPTRVERRAPRPSGVRQGAHEAYAAERPIVAGKDIKRSVVHPRHDGSLRRRPVGTEHAQAPHFVLARCEAAAEARPFQPQPLVRFRLAHRCAEGVQLSVAHQRKVGSGPVAVVRLIGQLEMQQAVGEQVSPAFPSAVGGDEVVEERGTLQRRAHPYPHRVGGGGLALVGEECSFLVGRAHVVFRHQHKARGVRPKHARRAIYKGVWARWEGAERGREERFCRAEVSRVHRFALGIAQGVAARLLQAFAGGIGLPHRQEGQPLAANARRHIGL